MSREVLSAVSPAYELAAYATEELSRLFHDWLGEIERETRAFLENRPAAGPETVAEHLRVGRESAVFILEKLAREARSGESVDPGGR